MNWIIKWKDRIAVSQQVIEDVMNPKRSENRGKVRRGGQERLSRVGLDLNHAPNQRKVKVERGNQVCLLMNTKLIWKHIKNKEAPRIQWAGEALKSRLCTQSKTQQLI